MPKTIFSDACPKVSDVCFGELASGLTEEYVVDNNCAASGRKAIVFSQWVQTLAELVAYVKARPAQVSYASNGSGTMASFG